uniref:Uncharacterized protein n=1 Tax=Amphiprion ocellaris TaxID=80972 RepID=A0AAQ5X1Q4_AMPOC
MLPLFLGFQALLFLFLWLICLCYLFVSLLPKQWCRRISESTLDVSPCCPVCC